MYRVGNDLSRQPKMQFSSLPEYELLFGLPKTFWISTGIVASFVIAQLLHLIAL